VLLEDFLSSFHRLIVCHPDPLAMPLR
jgi:hypothetical protein